MMHSSTTTTTIIIIIIIIIKTRRRYIIIEVVYCVVVVIAPSICIATWYIWYLAAIKEMEKDYCNSSSKYSTNA